MTTETNGDKNEQKKRTRHFQFQLLFPKFAESLCVSLNDIKDLRRKARTFLNVYEIISFFVTKSSCFGHQNVNFFFFRRTYNLSKFTKDYSALKYVYL